MDDNIFEDLTNEEIENLYSEILEGPESILLAKCPSGVYNSSGGCSGASAGVCGTHYSDERLKDILGNNVDGLEKIQAINVVNFIYKHDAEKNIHVGVIAQDLKQVFPNSVIEDENGYLQIRTEDMFYAMINSIKELRIQNKIMEKRILTLESKFIK